MIVQGDNLHALKALLPRDAGQVKCIYIDPPYNTGNEGWAYNDNVNPLRGFWAEMPYFCLRVPTGGGKTWPAAKSVALVNTHLLRCDHSVVLWLVPSKPIREQTLPVGSVDLRRRAERRRHRGAGRRPQGLRRRRDRCRP